MVGLRQPELFAIHHRNLTTSSLSNPTTYDQHASMDFLRKFLGDGRKFKSTNSKPSQSETSSQFKPQPRRADPPTRNYTPDSFSDDATAEAVTHRVHQRIVEKDPQYIAAMRPMAFETPLLFFLVNLPKEDGYKHLDLGPLPRDIEYLDKKRAARGTARRW